MVVTGEVVGCLTTLDAILKVIARDDPDSLVCCVPIQQVLAKVKEALVRQAIIFQDDALFLMLEKPVDPSAYSVFAA